MKFEPTPLAGVVLIEPEEVEDPRGWFARVWCADEFARHGLDARFVQSSLSFNARRHTVRGMHYQIPPSREAKLVQVTAGRIFDAVADLREGSTTFRNVFTVELDARAPRLLYVPPQCAHGFQTLEDATTVLYCFTQAYEPKWSRSMHWRSPALGIAWPESGDVVISDADRDAPP